MIFLFRGQPKTGKTTLANNLKNVLLANYISREIFHIEKRDLKDMVPNTKYNPILGVLGTVGYLDSYHRYDVIISSTGVISNQSILEEFKKSNKDLLEIYVVNTKSNVIPQIDIENVPENINNIIIIDITDMDEFTAVNSLLNEIQNYIEVKQENKATSHKSVHL